MKKEKIQAEILLTVLMFYIFLESSDLIGPKQYHVAEQNYPASPIDTSIFTTISGGGTATVSPSPSPSFGPDESEFS